MPLPLRFPLAFVLACAPEHSAAALQRPCDASDSLAPSRDLYCIELIPAPGVSGPSGRVELGLGSGPFTVGVAPDGRSRFQLNVHLAGLPPARSLGPYGTYIGWVMPSPADSAVRLGRVGNGRSSLGRIALEKFTVLITAEAHARVRQPEGRVVLRGQSPATRLYPPDVLELTLGTLPRSGDSVRHEHRSQRENGEGQGKPVRWTSVPMPRGLTMWPREMTLLPEVDPWLPSGDPPDVRSRELIRLNDGDTLRLEAGAVRRALNGSRHTMFAFNGQHSGPLIEVARESEITVLYSNRLPQPSSVHWHGIRLENRNDGTPGMTQPAVASGGEFTYRLRFPDTGIYWYHPHVREDLQQELGLSGNLLVRPDSADGYAPVQRESVLMLDDVLVTGEGLVPLGHDSPTHALMGRFGNQFLVNGETSLRLRVRRGEIVRFYLTNAASTRTLNLSFPAARVKLVGSDMGPYQREEWVESVVIAPAERYIVHVRFDEPGQVPLLNRVRALDHLYGRFFDQVDTLGLVEVVPGGKTSGETSFDTLRSHAGASELDHYRRAAATAATRTLLLTLETSGLPPFTQRFMQLDSIYFPPVEWSGTMPMMNWASTGRQVRWVLRDPATGKANMNMNWRLRRGEPVRVRLVNERQSIHAMQHPIHFHGQRFLVLSVNGEPTRNLVWKDTVLVPAGGVVDILLDPSNPGHWMGHCHISEHLSAGMMMGFTVE